METKEHPSVLRSSSLSRCIALIIPMLLLTIAACSDGEDHTLCPDSGIDQRLVGDWLRCEPAWPSGNFIPYNYGMRVLPDGSRQTLGVNWSTGRIEVAEQACPIQPFLCSGKGKFRYQSGQDSWRICTCTFEGDRLTIAGMPTPEANTQYYKRINPPEMFVAPVQYQLHASIDGAAHEAPMVCAEPAVKVYYKGGESFSLRSAGQPGISIAVGNCRDLRYGLPAVFELAGEDGNHAKLVTGCGGDIIRAGTTGQLTGTLTITQLTDGGPGKRRCSGTFSFSATDRKRVWEVRDGSFDAPW